MNKWLLWIVILAVIAFGVWKLLPGESGAGQDFSSGELLKNIPADTAFYLGGQTSKAVAEFMSATSVSMLGDSSESWEFLQGLLPEGGNAPARFLEYLFKEVSEQASNYGELAANFGVNMEGEYAVYLHGAVPVLHLPLADAQKFNALIDAASTEANWPYTEKPMGSAVLKTWALYSTAEDGKQVFLALATNDAGLVLTLIAESDEESRVLERLGQTVLKDSLQSSGEIAQIGKKYRYTRDSLMLISIERLVEGILQPESNSLGRDLLRYLSQEDAETFGNFTTAECASDFVALARTVPKMVSGYTALTVKGDTLYMDFHDLLEIKNSRVTSQLSAMRGHIPEYVLTSDDKFFSAGFGLNFDNLAPALTALWTVFTEAEFTCDMLVLAQDLARGTSPAMLGMATAMAQGVKGIGLSVYGFDWDEQTGMPSGYDALLSISASNPESLLALAAMVPLLSDQNIAADGTATLLDLPGIPGGIKPYVVVKGKALALYLGKEGAKQAAALEDKELNLNGLSSFSVNYRKLPELLPIVAQFNGLSLGACSEPYEFVHSMSAYGMDMNMTVDIADEGLVTWMKGRMDKFKGWGDLALRGSYSVERLYDNCQWQAEGIATYSSGKMVEYVEKDGADNCELQRAAHQWEIRGERLVWTGRDKIKIRDNCEAEWEEREPTNYTCELMNIAGDDFQCLYRADTGSVGVKKTLYRYRRQ